MDEDLKELWRYLANNATPFQIARLAKTLDNFCKVTMANPNAGMSKYGECLHNTEDCTHKEPFCPICDNEGTRNGCQKCGLFN